MNNILGVLEAYWLQFDFGNGVWRGSTGYETIDAATAAVKSGLGIFTARVIRCGRLHATISPDGDRVDRIPDGLPLPMGGTHREG